MIHTDVHFTTTDRKLSSLYESAKNTLFSSVKPFGTRKLLTEAADSDTITLNTGILTAQTLADYNTSVAYDCIRAFLVTLRKDGRLPSSLTERGGNIIPSYEVLTGFCFAEEAVRLCYLAKHKIPSYTEQLYETMRQFDDYLWTRHDLNANGCLEIFDAKESEEGPESGRFAPLTMMLNGAERSVSPFPVETFDLMAEAYSIRNALCELATLLGRKEEAEIWQRKADEVAAKVRGFLWLGGFSSCFDRDYRGSIISTLFVNNLFLLYYGVANDKMADAIISRHILDPKEFWTPMPLPTVAYNSNLFVNDPAPGFRGQPRGTTYLRAIPALEKYGWYSLQTAIGKKLLAATGKQNLFPVQFDPITCEPSDKDHQSRYAPTAAAVLETIKRFWGVYADRNTICWGTMGHEETGATSDYSFTWGNDIYRVEAEEKTTTGSLCGKRLFTVTAGTRVFTDTYGQSMRLVNVTDDPIDCICVLRNRTYSFRLAPDEMRQLN